MAGPNSHRYNIALLIFFIPYTLFEVPSNLILQKLAPSTWLSLIMVLWGQLVPQTISSNRLTNMTGISTIGMGVINNYEGLLAMRFLLGLFEAGLFPGLWTKPPVSRIITDYAGCIYLISMYYKRYELQWRLTLFFSASILAGAFGGVSTPHTAIPHIPLTPPIQLLAFAIAKMDGIAGYGGWRWIFILEGGVTAILGLITKFWLTDWPETATFLTDSERVLLLSRLSSDTGPAIMNRLDKRAAKRIFSDPKIYLGTAAYLGTFPFSFTSTLPSN
jgi:hypothetical protein